MSFGLGKIFGSYGTIPDILMGKKPGEALKDNLMASAVVGGSMLAGPAIAGAFGSAGAVGGSGLGAGAAGGAGGFTAPASAASFGGPDLYALGGTPTQGLQMPGVPAATPGQGLLSQGLDLLGKHAGTAKNVLGAADSAKGLLDHSPVQHQQMPNSGQSVGAAMGGLLAQHDARQQAELQANAERRRSQQVVGQQIPNQFNPYGGAPNGWTAR